MCHEGGQGEAEFAVAAMVDAFHWYVMDIADPLAAASYNKLPAVPLTATRVRLTNRTRRRECPAGVLKGCAHVVAVDVSSLMNTCNSLGPSFLAACSSLESVMFPVGADGRCTITIVWEGFLFYCTALRSIDLTGLTNVTALGQSFVAACPGLRGTAVDVRPLHRVTLLPNEGHLVQSGGCSVFAKTGWPACVLAPPTGPLAQFARNDSAPE